MPQASVTLGLLVSCSILSITICGPAVGVNNACRTTDARSGTCVYLSECQRLFTLYSQPRPLPPATLRLLQAEQCGSLNRKPLVCCRNEPDPSVIDIRMNTVPEIPIDVSTHPNVGLVNPDLCGQTSAARIINGDVTGVFEMPWMALLKYRSTNGHRTEESFKCGGSLINRRYILTAAHCLSNKTRLQLVSVRLGEHDTSTDEDCEMEDEVRVCARPPQNIMVESFLRHPGYSEAVLSDDIGLIRLAQPADVDRNNIEPICLHVGPSEQNKNLDRKKLIVAGWGTTELGVASTALLKVSVPVVSTSDCQNVFVNYNMTITGRQLCAGATKLKQDSCKGDSGGPLKTIGLVRSEASMIQYGVVSYGLRECGTEGVPAVYTRVSPYMKWILDNIKP